ncbi:hypothetical protein [Cytobacillus oceanisediminis]|uniref:hypothetical protein n=1 Tax=Cytobacillus oceanisediminis TaxID=665099 RepID=UPI00203B7339|nr:hypothetical protein [Cytobacillus oceanisediminis]MCM3406027.1 hypothetical protein [Cytobacillus oceanisediminis]
MELSFDWFKEYVHKNDQHGTSVYSSVLKLIMEFCDEEKIMFFYPKNYRLLHEMEYILFFEDGYLTISKEDTEYKLDRYYCKVLTKSIKTSRFTDKIELVIHFNNGNNLKFNNEKDSSFEREEEYLQLIKELNKII